MPYIDTIQKDGTTYDIQDKRFNSHVSITGFLDNTYLHTFEMRFYMSLETYNQCESAIVRIVNNTLSSAFTTINEIIAYANANYASLGGDTINQLLTLMVCVFHQLGEGFILIDINDKSAKWNVIASQIGLVNSDFYCVVAGALAGTTPQLVQFGGVYDETISFDPEISVIKIYLV